MVSGQKEDRIPSVARPDAAQPVAVDPRLGRHVVDRAQIVADVLSAVIARNLIEPLLPERRQAAPVRRHDDVALSRHQLQVPPVAPELAHDALRTALAVKQGRVFFRRIEIGRQHDPDEHPLAVGRFHPSLLDFPHSDTFVYLRVGVRDARHRAVRRIHVEQFGGRAERSHFGHDAPARRRECVQIVRSGSNHAHRTARKRHAAKLDRRADRRQEQQRRVVGPTDIAGIVVETFGQISLASVGETHHEQPVLIRFVARALHARKSDHRIVGRKDGILVVARHSLGQIARPARGYVVEINVRVGAQRVLRTRQFLAGIGKLSARMVPCDLRRVEIGSQRGVPRLALHDVGPAGHPAGHVGDEQVQVASVVPIVPVALHQIVVYFRLGLSQIGIELRRAPLHDRHTLDIQNPVARRSHRESFHAALDVGHLSQIVPAGRGRPNLTTARAVGQKIDFLSVGAPLDRRLVAAGIGHTDGLAASGRYGPDIGRPLILLHIVAGHRIEHGAPVGRKDGAPHASHFPHHLGSQDAGGLLLLGQRVLRFHSVVSFLRAFGARCRRDAQRRAEQYGYGFLHGYMFGWISRRVPPRGTRPGLCSKPRTSGRESARARPIRPA